jgi:hypothetical protein
MTADATSSRPALSVIVVNWNGGDLLTSCLRSLRGATAGVATEVLLVDNASSDGSAARAAAELPEAKLIRNSGNLGFARAVNQALGVAGGEFLLLLNPDARIEQHVVTRMIEVMATDARIGIVGCPSADENGRVVPGYETSYPGMRGQAVTAVSGSEHDVAWVSGACLMARRGMIAEIGPLDDGFFMYYEDVDWCYRARAAAWRVVTLPDVTVAHHLGGSSAHVSPAETERRTIVSRLRFYRKHYSPARAMALAARVGGAGLLGLVWHLIPASLIAAHRDALRMDCARVRAAAAGLLHGMARHNERHIP